MSGLTTLRDDDGSATITTAGLIVALILVVLALTHGIRGTIASHHAKVVADLSAVAGAYAAYTGADPCGTAATVARRNAAILDHCATSGDDSSRVFCATPLTYSGEPCTAVSRLPNMGREITPTTGVP